MYNVFHDTDDNLLELKNLIRDLDIGRHMGLNRPQIRQHRIKRRLMNNLVNHRDQQIRHIPIDRRKARRINSL